tara:strand:+ start:7491 stop:8450 length:960 start_codon:yes stop_codon:yes gene_type:complete
METLKKAIDEKRNIKPNSLNAYVISISKLHRATEGDGEFKNLDFLKDTDEVKEFLSGLKLSTQKNYLASIIVSLDAMNTKGKYDDLISEYRKILDDTHNKYIEDVENGEKSESQKKNWASMKELKKVMAMYLRDIKERELFSKEDLNKKQMALMQKWVIANLFLNEENPPTRLDYSPMEIISKSEYDKLDEEERKENNYLVVVSRNNKFFSFNEYKTSGKYGENQVKVGKKLNSVLNIWLKYNKTDSLLLNSQGKPMSANGLGKEIKKVFEPTGKNISVNMLRHIFISEKYPKEKLDEKAQDAKKMGHSVDMQEKYSKK